MISLNVPFVLLILICTVDMWELLKNTSPKLGDIMMSSWQKTASRKRDSISHKIPKDWILSDEVVEKAKQNRVLTGSFIEDLLDSQTLQITSLNSVNLVDAIGNGSFTAVQVTRAFCKRAAFAHQIVSSFLI